MEITYASSSTSDIASSLGSMGSSRQVKVIPLQHPYNSPSPSSSSFFSLFLRIPSWPRYRSWIQWVELFLPCARWIRNYKWREYLQLDLSAGLSVGIMLVPQAMSYAKLAGLHPIYGLYSGFVPVFVYAIFGSSRQLAIGPVALVSLLVSNVLSSIVDSSDELYTELAILLALMVGILESVMGLLRLGWLIRFISHAVISGFTTSSAIVIALSQAKYFLGYSVDRSSKIIPLISSIIAGVDEFSWPPFVMGSIFLAILLVMKHVVGDIPQGLPKFSIPRKFGYAKNLIATTFLITGVAILESVGIAKALAAKNGYELDANQELFGLGVANICGSFFSAYPTTGSFSRSAVNNESGAKTGLSGIIMGIIVGCALLFLTPLFSDIPQVDYEEAIFLWRVNKKDFLLWIITSITTLFLGIEIGVLVGVTVLGRLPGTTVYRNIRQYPEAYTYNGIVIVRIDAPIYFANISYIKDRLREYEINTEGFTKRGPEVEKIYFAVIEMAPVTYIDSSGIQALRDLHHEYKTRDIQMALANPNQEVLQSLARSGVLELIGKEWYFVRVHDAVQVCLQHVQELNQMPKKDDAMKPDEKLTFAQRIWKQRKENLSAEREPLISHMP
ncbi:hypothetical protein AMTRI_Chr08g163660 [Amborella trichopoda]